MVLAGTPDAFAASPIFTADSVRSPYPRSPLAAEPRGPVGDLGILDPAEQQWQVCHRLAPRQFVEQRQFGFAPRNSNSVVLEVQGLYCRPCTAIGLDRCPEKHFRCMMEIEPEKLLVQAIRLIA